MTPYAAEITESIRLEVKVHGAAIIARELGISEGCIRELAPKESREHDEAVKPKLNVEGK
jgi:hypothetical protein